MDPSRFLDLARRCHPSMVQIGTAYLGDVAAAEQLARDAWAQTLRSLLPEASAEHIERSLIGAVVSAAQINGRDLAAGVYSSGPTVDPDRFLPLDHPVYPEHWSDPPRRFSVREAPASRARVAVLEGIEQLAPAPRVVVILRDVLGWPASDVCALLGIDPKTQRRLIGEARWALAGRLERELTAVPDPTG